MRIAGLIRFLMVDSMRRHPKNRPALERQSAANGEKVLKSQGYLIRPVRVKPMVAHADAEPGTHPEEEERDGKCGPTEHEKCGDRSGMEKAERDAIGPVYFLPGVNDIDWVGGHRKSPGMNRLDPCG